MPILYSMVVLETWLKPIAITSGQASGPPVIKRASGEWQPIKDAYSKYTDPESIDSMSQTPRSAQQLTNDDVQCFCSRQNAVASPQKLRFIVTIYIYRTKESKKIYSILKTTSLMQFIKHDVIIEWRWGRVSSMHGDVRWGMYRG